MRPSPSNSRQGQMTTTSGRTWGRGRFPVETAARAGGGKVEGVYKAAALSTAFIILLHQTTSFSIIPPPGETAKRARRAPARPEGACRAEPRREAAWRPPEGRRRRPGGSGAQTADNDGKAASEKTQLAGRSRRQDSGQRRGGRKRDDGAGLPERSADREAGCATGAETAGLRPGGAGDGWSLPGAAPAAWRPEAA